MKYIQTLLLLISYTVFGQDLTIDEVTGSVGVKLSESTINSGNWTGYADLFVNSSVHAARFGWIPSDSFSHGTNDNLKIAHYGLSVFGDQVGTIEKAPKVGVSGYYGLKFFTAGQERINITNTGNIGIGTNTPNAKLNIVNSETIGLSNLSKSSILLGSAESGLGLDSNEIIAKGVDLYLGTTTEDRGIYFKAGGTTNRMTINGTTGFVGIGTTSPNRPLEVNGNTIIGDNNWAGLTLNGIDSNDWTFNAHNDGNSLHIRTQNDGENADSKYIMSIKRDTGSVGIGTTDPTEKLEIRGNVKINTGSSYSTLRLGAESNDAIISDNKGDNYYGGGYWFRVHDESVSYKYRDVMMLSDNGNVGIGVMAPTSKLHVNTEIRSDDGFVITGTARLEKKGTNNTHLWSIGSMEFGTGGGTTKMNLDLDGNVGIGTTDTQGFKLGVNGDIAATKVKVALYDNWPDFVFEDTYELPTLKEVEAHINENGHLQNVPSAKEVAENGFFLEEMNAKLLQKIEELTLYTIAQEKKIEQLTKENETTKLMQKQLQSLAKRLTKLEAVK